MRSRTLLRILIPLMLIVCLVGNGAFAMAASPPDIELNYIGLVSARSLLLIDDSGLAYCDTDVILRSGYTADITMSLQQSSNLLSWSDYRSWKDNDDGDIDLDTNYIEAHIFVLSGYYYRVHVTISVYDSSGQCVETVSKNSSVSAY